MRKLPLTDRDQEIINTLTRFGQMSSMQIKRLLFANQTLRGSVVTSHRRLEKLAKLGLINRIQYAPMGPRGAGGYIYQVGRSRVHKPHTLEISETYVRLKELERDYSESFTLDYFDPEPASWFWAGEQLMKPDAIMSVNGGELYLLEVDLATEAPLVLAAKFRRYLEAKMHWDYTRGEFPTVLFVVPNKDRLRQLERLLAKNFQRQNMFVGVVMDQLGQYLIAEEVA